MVAFTIYTYRDLSELRKIQEEREVYPFIFSETLQQLEEDDEICIDISALIYYLLIEKNNIQPAYINLRRITSDTVVIVNEGIVNSALELFPLLFSNYKAYYEKGDSSVEETAALPIIQNTKRRFIYKYNNAKDLEKIIEYADENDIPIATFSQANQDRREEFNKFNKSEKLALLDLTSMSFAIHDNKNIIYAFEQFIGLFSNISIISHTPQVDDLLEFFPLFFDGAKPISDLIPELQNMGQDEPEESNVVKITDLNQEEYTNFITDFSHSLIGHSYFKERLKRLLNNFILLNKAKEQKVLSIFLFGASGIGKTEVARLFANGLQKDSYLAKINFQNYSSQDALNSLIGSPAGYVGCNHGELSEKIQKSKVAVLLCDEFEKTTRPVFSFFLELLEDGRFTDSMAREYDMDGYIIIFTSNIPNENEYKKAIPPELQTRFDLVCEFEKPTLLEKREFLELLFEKAKNKYKEQFNNITVTDEDSERLFNFDYSELSSLRDIKRVFNNRLMDLFSEKL